MAARTHSPTRKALFTSVIPAVALAAFCGAFATSAHADVRAGVTAWEAGDYARAINEWRPLAINGDADAQFNLGQAYKLGRGVQQDLPQASEWFRRAAAQGHLQAEDNLGLVLYELNRKADAMPWLQRSAERGEPRAQYVLAAELYNGERISRDPVRAYAFMKRASDAGLQRASAALGQMDQALPLEQRQEAIRMANAMEQNETQARLAAMTATAPARATPTPSVRPTPLPASTPGTAVAAAAPAATTPGVSYTPPPVGVNPAQMPAARTQTPTPRAQVATNQPLPRVHTAPASAAPTQSPPAQPARAAPRTAAAPAASGPWRIQLGAFSSRNNAEALWARIGGRLSGAQAHYEQAGNITRLQAGGYASRSAAEQACASVRPNACLVVAR